MNKQQEKDFEEWLDNFYPRAGTVDDCMGRLKLSNQAKPIYKAAIAKCEEREKKLVEALMLACEGSKIFEKFADCRKDTWACKCEFCRDHTSAAYLRRARQTLKELGYE